MCCVYADSALDRLLTEKVDVWEGLKSGERLLFSRHGTDRPDHDEVPVASGAGQPQQQRQVELLLDDAHITDPRPGHARKF